MINPPKFEQIHEHHNIETVRKGLARILGETLGHYLIGIGLHW